MIGKEKRNDGRVRQKGKTCTWPGCTHNARCKGYCVNHYQLYQKYGDPTPEIVESVKRNYKRNRLWKR